MAERHKREAQQDHFLKDVTHDESDMRFRSGRIVRFKSRKASPNETVRLDPMWPHSILLEVRLLEWLVEILSRDRVPNEREDGRGS